MSAEVSSLWEFGIRLGLRAIDVAIAGCSPTHVLALFSGGSDSIVATHVAAQHPRFDGAVFIDTGTALPGVREHAEAVCADQGWPLTVIRSPETYEDMIREHGLPGPGKHGTAYVRLKEKALDAHVRTLCSKCQDGNKRHRKHDTVLWVSGARTDESKRRMGTATWMTVDGAQVWVNPILDWLSYQCSDYRRFYDLPVSFVSALIHRSGECNCGTYKADNEREMLCALFPEFAAQLDAWERLALESGHEHACRWGERPLVERPGQLELVPRVGALACSDCEAMRVPPSEAMAA